jgi:hypothetical protein
MNDSEKMKHLPRVTAPSGFEDLVLDALQARLRLLPGRRRSRTFRLATAGTAAGLLAVFVALNLFVLRGPDTSALSATRLNDRAASEAVPLNEPVNYRHEVRTASVESRTVYILEQVSEASNTLFKY